MLTHIAGIGIPRASLISCAISLLLAVVVLPIWQIAYVGSWEITEVRGWLWQALMLIPQQVREVGCLRMLELHINNIVVAAAIFIATAAFGRGILDVIEQRQEV